MSKKLEIIRKICEAKRLEEKRKYFDIPGNQLDVIQKEIVWENRLVTPFEFVQIDEAVRPNSDFGTNSPDFNNGQIHFNPWALTVIKPKADDEPLFIACIETSGAISFFPVKDCEEGDSLEQMHQKLSIRQIRKVRYTTLVMILGALAGFVLKYIKEKNPKELHFIGLTDGLVSLYKSVMTSKTLTKELVELGYTVKSHDKEIRISKTIH